MKIKIEIKTRISGKVLFVFETENNTVKETIKEAVKQGAYLQGAYLQGADLRSADLRSADLRGAYLRGADLQGAYLRGAYLRDAEKIKLAAVFTGLYNYVVIPYITESGENRVKMGCYNRSVEEWDADFWNNGSEFPNDNSIKSNQRLFAYQTAKNWLKIG